MPSKPRKRQAQQRFGLILYTYLHLAPEPELTKTRSSGGLLFGEIPLRIPARSEDAGQRGRLHAPGLAGRRRASPDAFTVYSKKI